METHFQSESRASRWPAQFFRASEFRFTIAAASGPSGTKARATWRDILGRTTGGPGGGRGGEGGGGKGGEGGFLSFLPSEKKAKGDHKERHVLGRRQIPFCPIVFTRTLPPPR